MRHPDACAGGGYAPIRGAAVRVGWYSCFLLQGCSIPPEHTTVTDAAGHYSIIFRGKVTELDCREQGPTSYTNGKYGVHVEAGPGYSPAEATFACGGTNVLQNFIIERIPSPVIGASNGVHDLAPLSRHHPSR